MQIPAGLILLLLILISGFFGLSIYSEKANPPAENIVYGVTFAPRAAEFLGFDWKQVYGKVLDDLKVKHLRLPGYWNVIEKTRGVYDFSETDFMLKEAGKREAKVIFTLGMKQPRWPECHVPDWALELSVEERQVKALEFITEVVQRYKNESVIVSWQVENEPLLYFFASHCDKPDLEFLKQEVALVKSLDSRPIIISDSGELSLWGEQMKLSDIFGTTLYRTTWNPIFGYNKYPWPPGFYSLRSNFFRKFIAPDNKKTIVVELQAEPWFAKNTPLDMPVSEQGKLFSLEDLKDNVEFARKTGFDEIYLWGVEWWFFMKEKGNPGYWDYAKKLF